MIPLGPFELEEPVARGGMGEVWRGRTTRGHKPVAVKVIRVASAQDSVFSRYFQNEVRAVAALDHDNVIRVFDYGHVSEATAARSRRLEAGSPYLVMEWISGGSLLERAPLASWTEIRRALGALLRALGHAHARGVLHRDVKPNNVLLPTGDLEDLRLADFGIARAPGLSSVAVPTGGTRAYMAPEQLVGHLREEGPWTDLYAVGCVALKLLRGQVRLGHRPAPARVPAVPAGLPAWIAKLVETNPAMRFRRAADALAALQELGDAKGTEAELTAAVGLETLIPSGVALLEELEVTVPATRTEVSVVEQLLRAAGARTELPAAVELPIPPWRAVDPPPRPREIDDVGLGLYGMRPVPLAGREAERDTLWQALADVHAARAPRAVVLRGAAGTGKSRLCEWLCQLGHETGVMTPIGARGDLGHKLRAHLRCLDLSRADLVARMELLCARYQEPDPDALSEVLSPSDGSVVFRSPAERHAAAARIVAWECRERPVVLWLDDVHEDVDALGFAEHLVNRSGLPVLVLLTLRDEALAERPVEAELLERVLHAPETCTLAVPPLPESEWPALVRGLLGLSGDLALEVERRSAGNPLFLVQLVGAWIRRGELVADGGRLALAAGAHVDIPEDLRSIWDRHLDEVLAGRGPDDAPALELLAVLGEHVELSEWHAALRERGLAASGGLMDALLARKLLTADPRAPDRVTFVHGMLRESLELRARDAGRLAEHHAACARLLEPQGLPERVGHHWLGADDFERAFPALLAGAWRFIQRGDFRAALLCALDATRAARAPAQEAEVWVTRARIAQMQGDYAGASAWAARAETAARALSDERVLTRALLEGGNSERTRGDMTRAAALLEEAATRASALADDELVGRAENLAAYVCIQRGQSEAGVVHAQTGLAAYGRAGLPLDEARCHLTLSDAVKQVGRLDDARAHAEAALRRFADHGDRWGQASCHNVLGDIARLDGDLARAERHYREALERFATIGTGTQVLPRLNLAQVLVLRRDHTAAGPLLKSCAQELEAQGRRPWLALVRLSELPLLGHARDWPAWDRTLADAEALLSETQLVDVDLPLMAGFAADEARAAGHADGARKLYALAGAQWLALGREDRAREVAARAEA
ncbi:MAG: protein kinase [Myxococcales bacterium]|nr:protein kinase [Myxococcales bacterium]MCB9580940.1 protein kinase [Polyangiaceae bacterium]